MKQTSEAMKYLKQLQQNGRFVQDIWTWKKNTNTPKFIVRKSITPKKIDNYLWKKNWWLSIEWPWSHFDHWH